MDEKFLLNLLRMVAAETYFQNVLSTSREMFGRGYFALGAGEKAAVDQTVLAQVGVYYQAITPEFLEGQQAKLPMGFPIQGTAPTQESPKATPPKA